MNMPTVGCVGESIIGNDERGLWFLSHKDDPSQMNWVEGEKCWGSVKVPMGLNVTRTLSVLENGELEECYTFENVSGEPLFIKEKDAYIYVPFNDSYEKAEVGLEKRCNAHLFIGENATYVMALRQGGRAPHLGLVLTKGSIKAMVWNVIFQLEAKIAVIFSFIQNLVYLSQVRRRRFVGSFFGIRARMIFTTDF